MKRFFLFIIVIFGSFSIISGSNPFLEIFRKYFPNTYTERDLKNIRSFVGDSIYFDISGNYPLYNVSSPEIA